jgi:hypothetical protein
MARRKAEPAERGARRAETNAVAADLTALRAPKVPAWGRATLEKRAAPGNETRWTGSPGDLDVDAHEMGGVCIIRRR